MESSVEKTKDRNTLYLIYGDKFRDLIGQQVYDGR